MDRPTYDQLEELYIRDIAESLFEVLSSYEQYNFLSANDMRIIAKETEYVATTMKNSYDTSKEFFELVLNQIADFEGFENTELDQLTK